MRHGFKGRRFARSVSHRKSMFANLAVSLIEHEQIVTTLPKAKDLRPIVEKLVTLGKRGDLHARRQVIAQIGNEGVVKRLFDRVVCVLGVLERRIERPQRRPGARLADRTAEDSGEAPAERKQTRLDRRRCDQEVVRRGEHTCPLDEPGARHAGIELGGEVGRARPRCGRVAAASTRIERGEHRRGRECHGWRHEQDARQRTADRR